jgi:hypothetical protein
MFFFQQHFGELYFVINPLTYGGVLIGPPIFSEAKKSKKLLYKKIEKISIPLLGTHVCESILDLL